MDCLTIIYSPSSHVVFFPQELESDVFVNQTSLIQLNLNGNHLKTMNPESIKGLQNIEELSFRDCGLTSIQDGLFSNKDSLRDLDLGQNRLTTFLSVSGIAQLSSLRSLNFDNNEIQNLHAHAFKDMNLEALDLSYNRLNKIDVLAFQNSTVKDLDLSYNMIFPLKDSFLGPLSAHVKTLNLAGNPVGKLTTEVFSELQELERLNMSVCRLDTVPYETFKNLRLLNVLDISHNNIHFLSQEMVDYLDQLQIVYLHQNTWTCECHIKPLSKWLKNPLSKQKMICPLSRSRHQDCSSLRCVMPSEFFNRPLVDLREDDIGGCQANGDSNSLPASTQGAIVASCLAAAVFLLFVTIYLWKRGKTHYGLKRVCVPSDAESSHVLDEDDKVPPLSNCDRASLNVSDHEFVVRHYFDTLVTDPKLMSNTEDTEEPKSPKERDSLYSSQPSLYSHPSAPLGIESTV